MTSTEAGKFPGTCKRMRPFTARNLAEIGTVVPDAPLPYFCLGINCMLDFDGNEPLAKFRAAER